jgi:hypothetical protein
MGLAATTSERQPYNGLRGWSAALVPMLLVFFVSRRFDTLVGRSAFVCCRLPCRQTVQKTPLPNTCNKMSFKSFEMKKYLKN